MFANTHPRAATAALPSGLPDDRQRELPLQYPEKADETAAATGPAFHGITPALAPENLRSAIRTFARDLLSAMQSGLIPHIQQAQQFCNLLIGEDTVKERTGDVLECIENRLRETGQIAAQTFLEAVKALRNRLKSEPLDEFPSAEPIAPPVPVAHPVLQQSQSVEPAATLAPDPAQAPGDAVSHTLPEDEAPTRESSSTIVWVSPDRLVVASPFKDLFPMNPEVKARIVADMRKNGYDESQPVVVWKERNTVVDGHTRRDAAVECGLDTIPTVHRSFKDEDEALKYAIHAQQDRRNLTDADILRLTEQLDQRRKRGGDRKSEGIRSRTSPEVSDPSSVTTAKLIGTSPAKVEKARAVNAAADPTIKADVAAGRMSLNKAAAKVRAAKKSVKANWDAPSARVAAVEKAKAVAGRKAITHLNAAEAVLRPQVVDLADRIAKVKDTVEAWVSGLGRQSAGDTNRAA